MSNLFSTGPDWTLTLIRVQIRILMVGGVGKIGNQVVKQIVIRWRPGRLSR
jgi:hypothetical protein